VIGGEDDPRDLPQRPVPRPAATDRGITVDFAPLENLSPAMLVNRQPVLRYLNVTAPPEEWAGRTVTLAVHCDAGSGSSTYRSSVKLAFETTPVPVTEVVFPNLYELADRRAQRRQITFTASVRDGRDRELATLTRTAAWMGPAEWLNQPDTWEYLPAFVNPHDKGVRRVFATAADTLRSVATPADNFTGYFRHPPDPTYVRTQLRAVYQALRDGKTRLTYIAPPGSPVFVGANPAGGSPPPGPLAAAGQVVRSHTEVVAHRLGTCHDLALLLAACGEYVGIRPLVVLVRGHTLVGFWRSQQEYENYWGQPNRLNRRDWKLTSPREFVSLIQSGQILVVETTLLGDPVKTFDEACDMAKDYLTVKWPGHLNVAVDVYRARAYGINPL